MQPHNATVYLCREDLLRSHALRSRIVYLQAPCGYGKSILADQYARRFQGITLQPSCGDMHALRGLLRNPPASEPRLFLLEDVHLLNDDHQKSIARLMSNAPEHDQFLLTSRKPPSSAFAILQARGYMRVIPPSSLLFTPAEISELERCYLQDDDLIHRNDRIAALMRETRGWPAAFMKGLAHITSVRRFDPAELAASMHDRLGSVLSELPDSLRFYLSQIAVFPEQQSLHHCSLLTENEDSAAYMLELRAISPLLSVYEEGVSLFPILARHLRKNMPTHERRALSAKACRIMLEEKEPDAAMRLAVDADRPDLLRETLRAIDVYKLSDSQARGLLPYLQFVARRMPPTGQERLLIGICNTAAGHYKEAAEHLALLHDEAYASFDAELYKPATFHFARALARLGESAEAERHLFALISLCKQSDAAFCVRAFEELQEFYIRNGRTRRALSLCEYMLTLKRDSSITDSANLYRAILYLHLCDIKQCERALTMMPHRMNGNKNVTTIRYLYGLLTGRGEEILCASDKPSLWMLYNVITQQYEDITHSGFAAAQSFAGIISHADAELLAEAAEAPLTLYNPVLWRSLADRANTSHRLIAAHILQSAALHAFSRQDYEAVERYAAQCRDVSERAGYAYYLRITDALFSIIERKKGNAERARTLAASFISFTNEHGLRFPRAINDMLKTMYADYAAESIEPSSMKNNHPYRIDVHCFGSFTVAPIDHPENVLHFRTRKAQELLAYLVHYGDQMIERDQIMLELWPERSQDKARTLLHTTLYNVRRALDTVGLEDWIFYERHSYGLSMTFARCDTTLLSTYLAQAATMPEDALRENTRMLRLYSGPYMHNVDGSWHLTAQAQFEQNVVDIHRRLAIYLQRIGEYKEAVDHLTSVTIIDPFHEASHLQLIECQLKMGNRAMAIRQYQHMCRILKDELGVSPEETTFRRARALFGSDAAI